MRSRAQQLNEREAALAERERRAGGGMDSELLAETLRAMPCSNGKAGSREVHFRDTECPWLEYSLSCSILSWLLVVVHPSQD